MRSLLVFRNNKLVAETYLKDDNDITYPRAIWSCTKQILGVLTGLAIEKEIIDSVNDSISTYLSDEIVGHDNKSNITIEDLLTMRSGINFDEVEDSSTILQELPNNTIEYILDLPMIYSPSNTFNYNSGDPHLIAASIQNGVDKPLNEWADEVLFSKIGFTNYEWLKYDGYNYEGWGVSTTPRELAKIAHLVMNNGNWNGEQIVDSLWIEDMLSPHIQNIGTENSNFGYLWWGNNNELGNISYMAGSGGQFVVIVPDKELVIVAMSEHDTDGDLELRSERFFEIVKDIFDITY